MPGQESSSASAQSSVSGSGLGSEQSKGSLESEQSKSGSGSDLSTVSSSSSRSGSGSGSGSASGSGSGSVPASNIVSVPGSVPASNIVSALASGSGSYQSDVPAPSLASGSGSVQPSAPASGSQPVQPSGSGSVSGSGLASSSRSAPASAQSSTQLDVSVSGSEVASENVRGSGSSGKNESISSESTTNEKKVEQQTQNLSKQKTPIKQQTKQEEQPTKQSEQLKQLNSQLSKRQNDESSKILQPSTRKKGSSQSKLKIEVGDSAPDETVKGLLLKKITSLKLKNIFEENELPSNDIKETEITKEFAYYFLGKHLNGERTSNNNDEILKIFNKMKSISSNDEPQKILDAKEKINEKGQTAEEIIKEELKEEIKSQLEKLNNIYGKKITGKDSASAMDIILSFSIGSRKDLLQKIVKGEYLGKVDSGDYFGKMSNMKEVMRKLKTTKSRFSKEHRFLKRLKKKIYKKTQRIIKFKKLQKKSQNKQKVLLKMQITRGIYEFLKYGAVKEDLLKISHEKDGAVKEDLLKISHEKDGAVEKNLLKISPEGMLSAIKKKLNKLDGLDESDESDESDKSNTLFGKNKGMLEKQVGQLMKSFHDSPNNLESVKKAIMKQLKREENKLAKESGVYGGFLKRAYCFFTFHKLSKDEAIKGAYKAEEELQEREANRLGKFKETDKMLQKAWSRLQKIQAKENVTYSVKGLSNILQPLTISDVLDKKTVGRSQ